MEGLSGRRNGSGCANWGWESPNGYIGNYGDNSLLYFHQYQNALPGTPLADRAKTGTNIAAGGSQLNLFDIFRQDVENGTLPKVSWIASPEAYSEHANWPANFGAWYISQVLDILTSNPEVWSKTILFINWDENDGGFDHMVAPTPPQTSANGLSTVDITNEIFAGDAKNVSGPYGLGTRVPLLAISPWSKGGYVNSQVFDHTSLIRFIEQRFGPEHPGLIEPNITPWRRAVAGDLTSIFNFANPTSIRSRCPAHLVTCRRKQKPTRTINRAAPAIQCHRQTCWSAYRRRKPASARLVRCPTNSMFTGPHLFSDKTFRINFGNIGRAAAVFQVRSGDAADLPRSYTVEAGKSRLQMHGKWDQL